MNEKIKVQRPLSACGPRKSQEPYEAELSQPSRGPGAPYPLLLGLGKC